VRGLGLRLRRTVTLPCAHRRTDGPHGTVPEGGWVVLDDLQDTAIMTLTVIRLGLVEQNLT